MGLLSVKAQQFSQEPSMLGCADLLSSPSSYIEKHRLTGSDEVLRFAVGRNVILHVESQQCVRDSARANSQPLSEYKWDSKTNNAGRILAAHEKLVAYRLFNETTGEAVRVLEREQRHRHLIKDFRHPTVDLQWAVHAPLLAVLDANGNLYIYSVDENGEKLTKYLIIVHEDDHTTNGPARLVWCPFVPEEAGEEVHLLGVFQGKEINLFMLNKIKEEIGRTEVTFERVQSDVKGGMLSFSLDSDITACRISPDATALAAATANGDLVFYVMEEWENVQAANRLRPLNNNHIEELVFLDNLSPRSNHSQDEQFWKYVVLSSDNGRRLALYECDTWQCCAKLRFESPNQVNRMELLVEPSMHFLFVADYDASNLFCIELNQPASSVSASAAVPTLCFAACTQITFCNPMICMFPCSLTENYDSAGDLSLEEDDQGLGGGSGSNSLNTSAIVSLVAITNRSLLEINVELDRVFTVDPSVATSAAIAPTASASSLPQQSSLARSAVTGQTQSQQPPPPSTLPMPPPPPEPPVGFGGVDMDPKMDLDPSFVADILGVDGTMTATAKRNNQNNGGAVRSGTGSGYISQISNANTNNCANNAAEMATSTIGPPINGEAVEELKDLFELKFNELTKKVEDLSLQVRGLQEENDKLRANQADNLSNVLEKISNELESREERMEAFMGKQNKENAERVLRNVESFLLQHSVSIQRTVDMAQTRHSEQMHLSLERSVVPQVEVFCTHLFTQLNDKFHTGLQEFMDQLKTISSQQLQAHQQQFLQQQQKQPAEQQQHQQPQLTPMEKLNRLVDSNQLKAAFELALTQSDKKQQQHLLLAVCKRVDPDAFFNAANSSSGCASSPTASPPPPLPISVLLQLLLQLPARLDIETELKFRYVENALMALNSVVMASRQAAQSAKAMGTGEGLRVVMERLSQAFGAFGEQDANTAWKRQIRLMNQLIANMLAQQARQ